MANETSTILFDVWSWGKYANTQVICLITLGLIISLIIYISRHTDHWGNFPRSQLIGPHLAVQKEVETYKNPFFLQLSPTVRSSLADGVALEASVLSPCSLHVLWGPCVRFVHSALLEHGLDFVAALDSPTYLHRHALAARRYWLDQEGRHNIRLHVPGSLTAARLGATPRQRYPCVVVMAATRIDHSKLKYTDVVATVTVLHLKDEQVPLESHVVGQYAKMACHAVYKLKPLFFSTQLEEAEAITPDNTHTLDTEGEGPGAALYEATDLDSPANDTDTHVGDLEPVKDDLDTAAADLDPHAADHDHDGMVECMNCCAAPDVVAHLSPPRLPAQSPWEWAPPPITFCHSCGRWNSHRAGEGICPGRDFPECIVCQLQPVNCVLLPCRHAAVCCRCFHQLDRCPVCRSFVEAYFLLQQETVRRERFGPGFSLRRTLYEMDMAYRQNVMQVFEYNEYGYE